MGDLAKNRESTSIATITQKERDELLKISQNFYPQIYQLAHNIYSYNGIFLPTLFFEIGVFWHKHCLREAFEPHVLEKMKQKDFIDVGACVGDSAIVFLEFCAKNIHAFEPTKKNYEFMLETIKLNHATRIIPVNKGLGSKIETQEMSIYGGASSIVFKNSDESESVEITTLDAYVEENNLEVGFIKVDIEGFEQEFLKGAKNTICAQKPAMLLSIYHTIDDYLDIKPMIEGWNLGYKFKIIKPLDFSLVTETALFCYVDS